MGSKRTSLFQGLTFGMIFGFLLQKGGVTRYDVVLGQLLLKDFTVVKIMLSAVVTGTIGIHLMKHLGWVQLKPKSGSWGGNVIGGLIFGVGFAVLGYCPGTIAGAMGNGYLDAVFGGLPGILIGSGILAAKYPSLKKGVLKKGFFGDIMIPELLKVNDWVVIVPLSIILIAAMYLLELAGV